jgi:hypothetical protein
VSRNITSSKTKGIGEWTDAEIKTAITHGVRWQQTQAAHGSYYAGMTNSDLDAIGALAHGAGEGLS